MVFRDPPPRFSVSDAWQSRGMHDQQLRLAGALSSAVTLSLDFFAE